MQAIRCFAIFCFAIRFVFPTFAQDSPLTVVTTTTIIADIAANVGGDLVQVVSLVPPESDAHAFQPRPSDIVMLSEADIVLANGLGLEGFLDNLLESVNVTPAIVSEGIVPLVYGADNAQDNQSQEDAQGEYDPHVWTNPQNVLVIVDNIATIFADRDPDNADAYLANAESYKSEIEILDAEIEMLFNDIPVADRLLVTNHEFLAYFADRYDFTVVGTVIRSVSTLSQPNPRELAALIQQVRDLEVRVIFIEFGSVEGLSDTLAREIGSDIQIVELYSASLSEADGLASTYLDYMRFNAEAIAATFD
ncbi:MAG: metal ABC transporter substrate-binding protein [Anaerolineae bacterium]|nr:metal ABC transporter substrate-binding protein [Anaerolineae bacterium]MDQ7035956.1 metal ABC transporter substrate-binding protein [Anaerolineae bacterium]